MATASTQPIPANSPGFFVSLDNSEKRPAPIHKRTYQACIPCRRRKVRCDLGSVDDPHDPPCVRCRRESKECFFSATRKKRKTGEEEYVGVEEEEEGEDSFLVRDPRVRTSVVRRSAEYGASSDQDRSSKMSASPESLATRSRRRRKSIPRPLSGSPFTNSTSMADGSSRDEAVTNETAAALFQSPINNPGDALHLLFEAAGRTGDLGRQSKTSVPYSRDQNTHSFARNSTADSKSPVIRRRNDRGTQVIDPAIGNLGPSAKMSRDQANMRKGLQAWSRLRFVRAGWFTPAEAISYIDYFYDRLAPLTPISPPNFRSPATHETLLNEEPMLTVTILTIASRYKTLPGPGSQSRSIFIHEKLWKYLQRMITRMFWGQEQIGGGFGATGALRKEEASANIGAFSDKIPKGGLRSLGTIESLLLLSDWHPRSMHFSPNDDDGGIVPLLETDLGDPTLLDNDILHQMPNAPGGVYGSWMEPAMRSDRMSWSLLGCANSLAYELGIFDSLKYGRWSIEDRSSRDGDSDYQQRANRLSRLLYIYINLTSGRLGFPSMLPQNIDNSEGSYITIIRPYSPNVENRTRQDAVENVQRAWAEITTLMKKSNEDLFASPEATNKMIQTGQYFGLLNEYHSKIRGWLRLFEGIDVPPYSRVILMMEYEYMRIYINSLALQAVLERLGTNNAQSSNIKPAGHHVNSLGALLSSSLVSLYKDNEPYITEVIDASRNLLRHVVDDLLPNDCLKHVSVRTHFRILSGAMFLLKTFALGAKEVDVATSMQLLDDTVKALRTSVVDDVHLCLRTADFLENLTSSLRNKFVRLSIHSSSNGQRSSVPPQQHHRTSTSAALFQHHPQHSANDLDANNGGGGGPSTDRAPADGSSSLYPPAYNNSYGPLAGITPTPIDPNDSTISIMPPPDFVFSDTHPNAAYAATPSPQNFNPSLSPHQSFAQQQQQQSQPSYSSSADTYDWLTLDVNPLLNSNNGGGGGGMNGPGGLSMWSGALGPEMGNNLEVLGMLANDGFLGVGAGGMGFGDGGGNG